MYRRINKRLTSFLLAITMVVMLLPVTAMPVYAANGTCGKCCEWTLTGSTLVFSYKDDGSHSLVCFAGPIGSGLTDTQKKNVTKVVFDDVIHSVQNETLSEYTGLTDVVFGTSVKVIGKKAFYRCTSLKSIIIPGNVTEIGEQAFWLSGLEGVKLSANLTTLGQEAFKGCKSLKSVSIPGKLKKIPKQCFYSCTALKSVEIGAGVEEIGVSAFQFCDNLTEVKIPSSTITVSDAAFGSCTKLNALDLSNVSSIGHLAVTKCLGISEIKLSNKLENVDSEAFMNNYTGKKVIFDGTKEEFEKIANKTEPKNEDLLTGTVQYLQASSDLPTVQDTEKKILSMTGNAEVPGAVFNVLRARAAKIKLKRIQLRWKAVPEASGYIVYGGPKTGAYQKLTEINSAFSTSFSHIGLDADRYYKYIVVAYKNLGSGTENQRVLSCSPVIYAATRGGKFRNTDAVKASSKKLTLKKGKKQKLQITVQSKASAGKKYRTFRKICFESTNPAVAAVNKKGRVRAVGKGTCYIFAYSQDGKFVRIKVTVQ